MTTLCPKQRKRRTIQRTAHQPHTCAQCGRAIQVGEVHYEGRKKRICVECEVRK